MKKISIRTVIQLIIFILIVTLALLHQKFGIEKAAPIDAYCPFGAIESFFTLVFTWEFLKKIYISSFILVWIFIFSTFVFGRVFCSYFCPLGSVQEWLRILWKKIGFKKDLEVPEKFDKYLRYLKYIILLVVVYSSFYVGDLIFREYGPFSAFMHFWQEFEEKIFAYIVLILLLVWALFSKSLWCRYFCPLGAFFGIINKLGFHKIKRNPKSCNSCWICEINCPAKLKIKNVSIVKDADCISCGKCVKRCPKSSLQHNIFNKKVSKKKFSVLVVLLVFIPIILVPFTSIWKTKPDSNIVNTTGEINVDDIRGSNTLHYIIETTKVPFEEFQNKLGLPENVDQSMKLKLIWVEYDIKNKDWNILETEDFREIIKEYIINENTQSNYDCPFWKINCEFPGECGWYIDYNEDKICDHSQ